ncbi:MAG TPA: GNAT family N-acetyltransferase [Tessaracoccus flavescens]|uniref:GNAT family N-acetyltransferase n=1 Tax=Tessaracoccus flavescens TaxID=399497 RepID=A0A921JQW3_9ACTN|nr:GNAT family N-acetyltransferase [Tessaracoccus flavescens]
MDAGYEYEIVPLDMPDDDPRWAAYQDIFSFSFLDNRPSEDETARYRESRRADGSWMAQVTTTGQGLEGREAIAGFCASPTTINCGKGLVDALVINTIAVRPSHRRRGLLKEMMRRQLDAAVERGQSLATLTASEATIYGRFGFGISTHTHPIQLDTRRMKFRDDVTVSTGRIEYVHPSFLIDHWARIVEAHQSRYRGAVAHQHGHFLRDTGQWDSKEQGPSRALRCAVHFGDDGVVDGFALFTPQGWDDTPITTAVHKVCAPDQSVNRALWWALASMDLVERLTYPLAPPGEALSGSLVDPWAVEPKEGDDPVWLRILDLPSAVAQRRFDGHGDIVVRIKDAQGYCDGVWRIWADGDDGTAERTEAEPEVELSVDVLAMMWHGDRTASQLALSGLLNGEEAAIGRLSRLFQVDEPPMNLATF